MVEQLFPPLVERRSTAREFAATLKKTQLKVFDLLTHAASSKNPWVDWETLRANCWPRDSHGHIEDGITRKHVYETIEALKEKAVTWSKGRATRIAIIDRRETKAAMTWALQFTAAPRVDASDRRPSFSWSSDNTNPKRVLPIWVPAFNLQSVEINVHPTAPWECHGIIPNYESFRETAWEAYRRAQLSSSRDLPMNRSHWHVARYRRGSNGGRNDTCVHLTAKRIEFKDFVATTLALRARTPGSQKTVKDLFFEQWGRHDQEHFPPAANLLAVDVNIITRDGKLIVRKETADGRFEPALFAYVDALEDVHRDDLHIPAPRETVFRACCGLMGFQIKPASLRWMGIGLGTEMGNVSLFGEIEVPLTFAEIEADFDRRVEIDKSFEIRAIDPTPEALLQLLREDPKPRRHMEVALVLSIKRRYPKLKISTAEE